MPKFVGRNVSVGFGKETVRGTAVAATTWFPKINISFDEKMETLVDETSVGSIVDAVGHSVVKRYSQGEIGGNLSVNSILLPLYAMFGGITSAVDTGTAYKHTLTLSNSNQSPSLTISMDDAVQDYRFPLCIISKMTIKVEPYKFVEVSMEFMGKKGASSTNTPAFIQDYSLKANNTTLLFATNLAGLDSASSNACIKTFEITFERTLSEDTCISSVDPADFISTVFSVSGSFEATYENESDYKNLALAGTTKAMRVQILDGSTLIGGATSSPELEIDLAKVGLTEWSRTVSTNEIVTQSVGFKGFYSVTDAQAVVARLINTTASI